MLTRRGTVQPNSLGGFTVLRRHGGKSESWRSRSQCSLAGASSNRASVAMVATDCAAGTAYTPGAVQQGGQLSMAGAVPSILPFDSVREGVRRPPIA